MPLFNIGFACAVMPIFFHSIYKIKLSSDLQTVWTAIPTPTVNGNTNMGTNLGLNDQHIGFQQGQNAFCCVA